MVKLSENTKIDLRLNNAWAILVSAIMVAASVTWMYFGIVTKIDRLIADTTDIKASFKDLHRETVENHDAILVLKQIVGLK